MSVRLLHFTNTENRYKCGRLVTDDADQTDDKEVWKASGDRRCDVCIGVLDEWKDGAFKVGTVVVLLVLVAVLVFWADVQCIRIPE